MIIAGIYNFVLLLLRLYPQQALHLVVVACLLGWPKSSFLRACIISHSAYVGCNFPFTFITGHESDTPEKLHTRYTFPCLHCLVVSRFSFENRDQPFGPVQYRDSFVCWFTGMKIPKWPFFITFSPLTQCHYLVLATSAFFHPCGIQIIDFGRSNHYGAL